MKENNIITVGFCPCWDVTCRVDGIEWGEHKRVSSQTVLPTGKALNISRALSWLEVKSIAAGLWGASDYQRMVDSISAENHFITPRFTLASGQTRQNLTVIDTKLQREMHLRAVCQLATDTSLSQLAVDLDGIVASTSNVVFAGSMPEDFLNDCRSMIERIRDKGAMVAVDTSDIALEALVKLGGLGLIKPNLEELGQLLGRQVHDEVGAIVAAARPLCDAARIILVSRGAAGALVVTKDEAFACSVENDRQRVVVNTVGCGDYLLAGFLSQIGAGDLRMALSTGVKVATARAWGLAGKTSWPRLAGTIKIKFQVE